MFLTFDDGPTPEITEWVLEQLAEYDAKATFFLIGENVERHPAIYQKILAGNHSVGNHTFHHKNGWKTADRDYLKDVEKCDALLQSKWFRPPYGRIRQSQIQNLKLLGYKIMMWDVLSGDFDVSQSAERTFMNVKKNVRADSIVVFHDSKKAWPNLREALPRTLEFLESEGYIFKKIAAENN